MDSEISTKGVEEDMEVLGLTPISAWFRHQLSGNLRVAKVSRRSRHREGFANLEVPESYEHGLLFRFRPHL